ncbi:polysaccharide pyruvyl transferase family protein [Polaribacter sp. IC073]|uniref:polysaccharide pyruvyl transferase family protein n=1 Tax=Polaribacter sp. IC073 TaxID=2508540 RepID=UPI0011BE6179|nr:polysaccharide pyruvyl transferase family protein [Polaribacter sp. IC073]TXD49698.1 hypothetical protein ES045_00490 [Polaribacter sp. IC073]
MNKTKKNILIINAYSYKNRGDSGIIVAMINLITKAYQNNVSISVMSQFHEENSSFYKKLNVKSVPPVWDILNQGGFINKYFTGLKKVISYKKQSADAIKQADLVLSAGGGYLYSSRKGPLGIGFINVLYHLWLSKKHKKKIILFPQSIGPLNFFLDKFLLKKVFCKLDLLFSRENITTKFLNNNNVNIKIKELPDVAFILEPQKNDLIDDMGISSVDCLKIGITVLDWRFASSGSDVKDVDDYLDRIANAINNLSKIVNQNIKVYIFPQVTVSDTDGDLKVSKELLNKLNVESQVFSLDSINNPKELVYLYSKMDVFIASRMHSAIFSLAGGVPTIGLAYQPKTTGTFDLINLKDFALDIKSFTKGDLQDIILKIIKNNNQSIEKIKKEVETVKLEITKTLVNALKD